MLTKFNTLSAASQESFYRQQHKKRSATVCRVDHTDEMMNFQEKRSKECKKSTAVCADICIELLPRAHSPHGGGGSSRPCATHHALLFYFYEVISQQGGIFYEQKEKRDWELDKNFTSSVQFMTR